MAVTLIHCFEVPSGREDEFLVAWKSLTADFAAATGYLGARLLRRSSDDIGLFAFVHVAQWASRDAWQAATAGDDYLAKLPAMRDFIGYSGVYDEVAEE